jgi:excisionase family DNA binding protein
MKKGGTFPTTAVRQAARPGMSRLDELLTADEVAELRHIPSSTVSDYARRGVLPSIKLGRHRRFLRSDVADAIESLRVGRVPQRSVGARTVR